MKLIGFSCKNYKPFINADIELKPLTVFFGSNSTGKTNLMTLILFLKDAINKGRFRDAAFRLEEMDSNIRVENVRDLFRNNDLKKPIKLTYSIQNQKGHSKLMKRISKFFMIKYGEDFQALKHIFDFGFDFDLGSNNFDFKSAIERIKSWLYEYKSNSELYEIDDPNLKSFLIKTDLNELDDIIYLINKIECYSKGIMKIEFTLQAAHRFDKKENKNYKTLIVSEM